MTFDKITAQGRASFKCAKCGKKRTRTKSFWMTQNPFNKDANGIPKSREQVFADVRAEAAKWSKETNVCAACES